MAFSRTVGSNLSGRHDMTDAVRDFVLCRSDRVKGRAVARGIGNGLGNLEKDIAYIRKVFAAHKYEPPSEYPVGDVWKDLVCCQVRFDEISKERRQGAHEAYASEKKKGVIGHVFESTEKGMLARQVAEQAGIGMLDPSSDQAKRLNVVLALGTIFKSHLAPMVFNTDREIFLLCNAKQPSTELDSILFP